MNNNARPFGACTGTKPVLRVLAGERLVPPPVWLMRQAGRYLPEYRKIRASCGDFLEMCLTPKLAAEVTLQPIRRFGMDAAIVFSDILMIPYGLGQPVAFREGEGPVLEPVRAAADLKKLMLDGLEDRLGPVYETLGQVRAALPATTTLIGFAGSPWTVATYMVEGGGSRDFTAVKAWAYSAAGDFQALMDILTEATARHLEAQVRAGAEVLQLFDTWAGVLPESFARRFVIAPAKEIVARLKRAAPRVPVIGFPKGLGALYADYVRETGVDAVSLDTAMPLSWAAREIPATAALQGNLDPLLLVAGGEAMATEVRRILAAFSGRSFIFNLGHGILPETPPEHVAELMRLLRAGA